MDYIFSFSKLLLKYKEDNWSHKFYVNIQLFRFLLAERLAEVPCIWFAWWDTMQIQDHPAILLGSWCKFVLLVSSINQVKYQGLYNVLFYRWCATPKKTLPHKCFLSLLEYVENPLRHGRYIFQFPSSLKSGKYGQKHQDLHQIRWLLRQCLW